MHLELNGWDTGITFSACHFIPGHDKCGRLHGHVYAISARVHGEQAEDGMLMDFIPLKKALRAVADSMDHRVLLPGEGNRAELAVGDEVEAKTSGKRYVFPAGDTAILDLPVVSAEELAKHVLRRILDDVQFPQGITRVEIGVDEGKGQGAWADHLF